MVRLFEHPSLPNPRDQWPARLATQVFRRLLLGAKRGKCKSSAEEFHGPNERWWPLGRRSVLDGGISTQPSDPVFNGCWVRMVKWKVMNQKRMNIRSLENIHVMFFFPRCFHNVTNLGGFYNENSAELWLLWHLRLKRVTSSCQWF